MQFQELLTITDAFMAVIFLSLVLGRQCSHYSESQISDASSDERLAFVQIMPLGHEVWQFTSTYLGRLGNQIHC